MATPEQHAWFEKVTGYSTAKALAKLKSGGAQLSQMGKEVINKPGNAAANFTSVSGPNSDDYKKGYQDGLSGANANPGARDPDALMDYQEGYAKGHYEFSKQSPSTGTPAKFTEADRIAALERNYAGWLAEGNWPQAAEELNTFSSEDITKKLARLTPEQIANIHQGALDNHRVGPQSNVARTTAPPAAPPAAPPVPGTEWEITTVGALNDGLGVSVAGIAFVLKDCQPGGKTYHLSFGGIGLGAGVGAKIKSVKVPSFSLSKPSTTRFIAAIPLSIADFNCGGKVKMADLGVVAGYSLGAAQFLGFKTTPEWLDIGGWQFSVGASVNAWIGRFVAS